MKSKRKRTNRTESQTGRLQDSLSSAQTTPQNTNQSNNESKFWWFRSDKLLSPIVAILTIVSLALGIFRILKDDSPTAAEPQNVIFEKDAQFKVLILPFEKYYDNQIKTGVIEKGIKKCFEANRMDSAALGVSVELDMNYDLTNGLNTAKARERGKSCGANLVIWGTDKTLDAKDSTLIEVEYAFVDTAYLRQTPYVLTEDGSNVITLSDISKIEEGHITADIETILWWIFGYRYYSEINYKKAIECFARIKIREEAKFRNIYDFLGSAYFETSNDSTAMVCFQTALKLDSIRFGMNHENMASDYNNLGVSFSRQGKYRRAIEYYKKALRIDSITSALPKKLCIRYDNLGVSYSHLEDSKSLDTAMQYQTWALQIAHQNFGEYNTIVSNLYNNIAYTFSQKKKLMNQDVSALLDSCLKYAHKAIDVEVYLKRDKHPGIINLFRNLAYYYEEMGIYDKAIEYNLKAVQITSEVYKQESHLENAFLYNNLGKVYEGRGDSLLNDLESAVDHYERALKIFEAYGQKGGNDTLSTAFENIAGTSAQLGSALEELREYDRALGYYTKSLNIFQKIVIKKRPNDILQSDRRHVAVSYVNIGRVYNLKGDWSSAIQYLNMGLTSLDHDFSEYTSEIDQSIGVTCCHLGDAFVGKGDYSSAHKYYKRGLPILQKYYPADHPRLIKIQQRSEVAHKRI